MNILIYQNNILLSGSNLLTYNIHPNVTNFCNVAGITATTQINALNTFMNTLIGFNKYIPNFVNFVNPAISQIKLIYPFIGTGTSTQSYNLINPYKYQITFVGGTNNNSGFTCTGAANSYAYCTYTERPTAPAQPESYFFDGNSTTDVHISMYTLLTGSTAGISYGSAAGAAFASGKFYVGGSGVYSNGNTNSNQGVILGNRKAQNVLNLWQNEVLNPITGVSLANQQNIFSNGHNVQFGRLVTTGFNSPSNFMYYSYGNGINNNYVESAYQTAINQLQKDLGRNVY